MDRLTFLANWREGTGLGLPANPNWTAQLRCPYAVGKWKGHNTDGLSGKWIVDFGPSIGRAH